MSVSCRKCGKTWPRDPRVEVVCSQCHAPIGRRCVRPSGHNCEIHIPREKAAIDAGYLTKHCPKTFKWHAEQLEIPMPKQPKQFSLTPQIRVEIIHSALQLFEKNWITRHSRELHAGGMSQAAAIKHALGSGGAADGNYTWDTHPKGLRVNYSKQIIPWSEMIPYIWPPEPVTRKPIKGKVKITSAWSDL